jgi:hypothetical protein
VADLVDVGSDAIRDNQAVAVITVLDIGPHP